MLARQTVLVRALLEWEEGKDGVSHLPGASDAPRKEHWVTSRVTDISRDGCGLISALALVPDMMVNVMFPGFEGRQARVIWVKGSGAGCAFATPLPAAILDYIIRMSDPAARG